MLVDTNIVIRVQPRTFKGITDLLLPSFPELILFRKRHVVYLRREC